MGGVPWVQAKLYGLGDSESIDRPSALPRRGERESQIISGGCWKWWLYKPIPFIKQTLASYGQRFDVIQGGQGLDRVHKQRAALKVFGLARCKHFSNYMRMRKVLFGHGENVLSDKPAPL